MWCVSKIDMAEPERISAGLLLGGLILLLVVSAACSTVDKARPPLPPAGTSPSGAELGADDPGNRLAEDESEAVPEAASTSTEEGESSESEAGDGYVMVDDPTPEAASESADKEETGEDSSVVIIDPGTAGSSDPSRSLVEAAAAERERRGTAPPTDIVITDKNLSDYATGQLTLAETPDAEATAAASELSALEAEMAAKEAYWRGGAREIRQAWRDAYDSIEELEAKVFELRQAFYREDDGFYRDAEIKPAWDRAIDQLEEARQEVEARQQELEEFLEAGREAGALPGWLREGIELEPKPVEKDEPIANPAEPVIYQPDESDPP